MCHNSVILWSARIPHDVIAGKTVIDVGSYDVNGSVRPFVESHGPVSYLGVDIEDGPGVDLVANVEDLPALYPDGFGLVISTEMLEHVESWKAAIAALVGLIEPGGHIAISTRSLGFPYHPYPVDTWRYSPVEMYQILTQAGLKVLSSDPDEEQAGVFAIARKPDTWKPPKGDWWPEIRLPIWDGSIPDVQ